MVDCQCHAGRHLQKLGVVVDIQRALLGRFDRQLVLIIGVAGVEIDHRAVLGGGVDLHGDLARTQGKPADTHQFRG